MKEINERSVSRANAGIIILGIVRGILYTVCALLTFLYSYLMLNAMNTNTGGRWGGWYMNAYASLMGIDMERDFYRFDYSQYEGVMDVFSNIERTFGPNWATTIYFSVVIVCLAVCVLLYLWARRMRISVALSEKD